MRIGKTIYLDHQASTPVNVEVFEKMRPFFEESFGNPHSLDHVIGWAAAEAVEKSKEKIASLVGGDKDEIIFTSGATEANNLFLLGLARGSKKKERKRIILSEVEHKSVLALAKTLNDQLNYKVDFIPVDSEGFIKLSVLEKIIDDDVLAVSIIAVNNEIGTIQDLPKISEIVNNHGAIFHCDAAQAPCAIDVSNLADLTHSCSFSAHKSYGPMGVGALFIRREIQNQFEPIIYGGGQQNNLRSGTVPTGLCVGMAEAFKITCGKEGISKRELMKKNKDYFQKCLLNLKWKVHINGPDSENRHPGNLNVRFQGFLAENILGKLQPHIAASTGSACTTGFPEPSHVLRAIGLSLEQAEASIRFSLGFRTTKEEIADAVLLIERTLNGLSKSGLRKPTS